MAAALVGLFGLVWHGEAFRGMAGRMLRGDFLDQHLKCIRDIEVLLGQRGSRGRDDLNQQPVSNGAMRTANRLSRALQGQRFDRDGITFATIVDSHQLHQWFGHGLSCSLKRGLAVIPVKCACDVDHNAGDVVHRSVGTVIDCRGGHCEQFAQSTNGQRFRVAGRFICSSTDEPTSVAVESSGCLLI
jgi:hypothetical protein